MRLPSCGARRRCQAEPGWSDPRRPTRIRSLHEHLDVTSLGTCAEVVRRAVAEGVAGYGRRARVETFCIPGQGFRVLQVDEIGPQVALEKFAFPRIENVRLPGRHREEVFDNEAEQVFEGGWVSAEADVVVRVGYPREE